MKGVLDSFVKSDFELVDDEDETVAQEFTDQYDQVRNRILTIF